MDQNAPTPEQLLAEVQSLRDRLARAEAALAAGPPSAEQLRLFVEHAPAAIAMVDREMKYLLASRRWLTEYQLDGQDIIGRSHYEVFPALPEHWKVIHGQCLAGEVAECAEDSFTLADGSVCWLRWAIHPWHEASGAVGGLLIFSEVITARKQAERALLEAQQRCTEALALLDTLLDRAPIGFAFIDRELRYVRINDALADMNGLSAQDHQNRTVPEVVPHLWPQLEPIYRDLLAGGEPLVNREVSGETGAAPGQTRHWFASHYPVRIGGEFVGIGLIVNEFTQQRLMEQQLQQAQRLEAIGTLAGGVAHEFNNLLQVITGFSDLMLAKLQPGDGFFDHTRQIKKAANRAAALTQELLAFGRKQLLSPKVLDPNDLLSQVVKLLRHLLGDAVELTAILKPRLGRIKVDPQQLEQALVTLALHARDSMPSGGKLTLETGSREFDEHYRHLPPGPYVLLRMSDTGPGMDAPTLDRIFEPFFTTRQFGQETGLGLASVYGIIKQSGGHIYAASEPGRGTVFSIYLPQVQPDPEGQVENPESGQPRGMETLLLTVGDELIRGYAATLLRTGGYQVLVAERGEQALTLAAQHDGPIHLLLTDLALPRMSGDSLAQTLTADRPDLKVLLLLGAADSTPAASVDPAAGRPFLRLPFTPSMLLGKVREVLDA